MKKHIKTLLYLLKIPVEKFLYFAIKFDILLVYAFSRTFLVVFYIFAIIGGFFAGEKADISTLFLFLFAGYVEGTSVIIMLVCRLKSTRIWVEKLVGTPFLEKFAPNRGKTNCHILFLSLSFFCILDRVSMLYFTHQTFTECAHLTQSIQVLVESGKQKEEIYYMLFHKKLSLLESVSNIKGICC